MLIEKLGNCHHNSAPIVALEFQPHAGKWLLERFATAAASSLKIWGIYQRDHTQENQEKKFIFRKNRLDSSLELHASDDSKHELWAVKQENHALNGSREEKSASPYFYTKSVCLFKAQHQSTSELTALKWSFNGNLLASADNCGTLCVHQLKADKSYQNEAAANQAQPANELFETWQTIQTMRYTKRMNMLFDIAWASDDKHIIGGSAFGVIVIFDVSTGEVSGELKDLALGRIGIIKGVGWDPYSDYLAAQSTDKNIMVWKVNHPGIGTKIDKMQQKSGLQFDLRLSTNELFVEGPADIPPARRLSWSPFGRFIAFPYGEHLGTCFGVCYEVFKNGEGSGEDFSVDSKPFRFRGHQSRIKCVSFCNDVMCEANVKGKGESDEASKAEQRSFFLFAQASEDGCVSIWKLYAGGKDWKASLNLREAPRKHSFGECVCVLTRLIDEQSCVNALSWGNQGRWLSVGCSSGGVFLVTIEDADLSGRFDSNWLTYKRLTDPVAPKIPLSTFLELEESQDVSLHCSHTTTNGSTFAYKEDEGLIHPLSQGISSIPATGGFDPSTLSMPSKDLSSENQAEHEMKQAKPAPGSSVKLSQGLRSVHTHTLEEQGLLRPPVLNAIQGSSVKSSNQLKKPQQLIAPSSQSLVEEATTQRPRRVPFKFTEFPASKSLEGVASHLSPPSFGGSVGSAAPTEPSKADAAVPHAKTPSSAPAEEPVRSTMTVCFASPPIFKERLTICLPGEYEIIANNELPLVRDESREIHYKDVVVSCWILQKEAEASSHQPNWTYMIRTGILTHFTFLGEENRFIALLLQPFSSLFPSQGDTAAPEDSQPSTKNSVKATLTSFTLSIIKSKTGEVIIHNLSLPTLSPISHFSTNKLSTFCIVSTLGNLQVFSMKLVLKDPLFDEEEDAAICSNKLKQLVEDRRRSRDLSKQLLEDKQQSGALSESSFISPSVSRSEDSFHLSRTMPDYRVFDRLYQQNTSRLPRKNGISSLEDGSSSAVSRECVEDNADEVQGRLKTHSHPPPNHEDGADYMDDVFLRKAFLNSETNRRRGSGRWQSMESRKLCDNSGPLKLLFDADLSFLCVREVAVFSGFSTTGPRRVLETSDSAALPASTSASTTTLVVGKNISTKKIAKKSALRKPLHDVDLEKTVCVSTPPGKAQESRLRHTHSSSSPVAVSSNSGANLKRANLSSESSPLTSGGAKPSLTHMHVANTPEDDATCSLQLVGASSAASQPDTTSKESHYGAQDDLELQCVQPSRKYSWESSSKSVCAVKINHCEQYEATPMKTRLEVDPIVCIEICSYSCSSLFSHGHKLPSSGLTHSKNEIFSLQNAPENSLLKDKEMVGVCALSGGVYEGFHTGEPSQKAEENSLEGCFILAYLKSGKIYINVESIFGWLRMDDLAYPFSDFYGFGANWLLKSRETSSFSLKRKLHTPLGAIQRRISSSCPPISAAHTFLELLEEDDDVFTSLRKDDFRAKSKMDLKALKLAEDKALPRSFAGNISNSLCVHHNGEDGSISMRRTHIEQTLRHCEHQVLCSVLIGSHEDFSVWLKMYIMRLLAYQIYGRIESVVLSLLAYLDFNASLVDKKNDSKFSYNARSSRPKKRVKVVETSFNSLLTTESLLGETERGGTLLWCQPALLTKVSINFYSLLRFDLLPMIQRAAICGKISILKQPYDSPSLVSENVLRGPDEETDILSLRQKRTEIFQRKLQGLSSLLETKLLAFQNLDLRELMLRDKNEEKKKSQERAIRALEGIF